MKNNPLQLLQFINSVARKAEVSYEIHAQVDMAIKELTEILTPKKEESKSESETK